jgi:polyferredoxin
MEKLKRPTRLIAYDTDINIRRRIEGKPPVLRLIRPRTILYAALLVVVGGIMLWTLAARSPIGVGVLHDRNPEYVLLSDGGIRNGYTVRILNHHPDARRFEVSFAGPPGAKLMVVGAEAENGRQVVDVGPDQSRELRAVVSLDNKTAESSQPITFLITDLGDGRAVQAADFFLGPRKGQP